MTIVLNNDSDLTLGDIRALGDGDSIVIQRSAMSTHALNYVWPAIGVAVVRGAELRFV